MRRRRFYGLSLALGLALAGSVLLAQQAKKAPPMTKQVERGRESLVSDVMAKVIIHQAFIEAEIDLCETSGRPSSLRGQCGASPTRSRLR